MNTRNLFVIASIATLASCASSVQKMVHPENGTVRIDDEIFVKERDECLMEYLQAQNQTEEAKEQTKTTKIASVLSDDLAALTELTYALGSNKEATEYSDNCLEEKGWSKAE